MLRTRILARACLALACGPVLALTGCSASTGTPDPAGSLSAPAPTATAGTGVSAAVLCAYLQNELPTLRAVGTPVGAEAQLTLGLAHLYQKNAQTPDGMVMDEQAQQQCPGVRTQVLTTIGKDGLDEL